MTILMRTVFSLLALFLWVHSTLVGQQDPAFSQMALYHSYLNPAVTGTDPHTELTLSVRRQWIGIEDAPTSSLLNASIPLGHSGKRSSLRNQGHHGIGVQMQYDKAGPIRDLAGYIAYAYHQPLGNDLRLALGTRLGFRQWRLDATALHFVETPEDGQIAADGYTISDPDLQIGLWLYGAHFFAGLGAHRLFSRSRIADGFQNSSATGESPSYLQYTTHRQYFSTLGYKWLSTGGLEWITSFTAQYAPEGPLLTSIGLKAYSEQGLWAAIGYRHKNGMMVTIGYLIEQTLELGYSYDVHFNGLQTYQRGSHELSIRYRLTGGNGVKCPVMRY